MKNYRNESLKDILKEFFAELVDDSFAELKDLLYQRREQKIDKLSESLSYWLGSVAQYRTHVSDEALLPNQLHDIINFWGESLCNAEIAERKLFDSEKKHAIKSAARDTKKSDALIGLLRKLDGERIKMLALINEKEDETLFKNPEFLGLFGEDDAAITIGDTHLIEVRDGSKVDRKILIDIYKTNYYRQMLFLKERLISELKKDIIKTRYEEYMDDYGYDTKFIPDDFVDCFRLIHSLSMLDKREEILSGASDKKIARADRERYLKNIERDRAINNAELAVAKAKFIDSVLNGKEHGGRRYKNNYYEF